MNRASFEMFADELRAQGFSEEKIREVLEKMIEDGLCEGNDEDGYILTEKGVSSVEGRIYRGFGVV